jgi:hypothetical protein
VRSVGGTPLENLIMDFTEMPQAQGCKYLLVLVCTFSGRIEAFPMRNEKAWEVARCLLKKIIPWFGISLSIGLDNGPAFVTEVVQLVANHQLRNPLEVAYSLLPQSSGRMKCMNKITAGQETHLQWDQLLSIELLRIRSSPTKLTGLSLFQVLLDAHPPTLIKCIQGDLKEISDFTLRQEMQALRSTLLKISDWVWERLPVRVSGSCLGIMFYQDRYGGYYRKENSCP